MASSEEVSKTTPQIIPVYDLIDKASSGEIRIPRFQRPYVWTPDDMIQLFDSIYHGYPIGSLLIWETDRDDISSLQKIGPIDRRSSSVRSASYVVDGHQRLATLVGVLALPDTHPSETIDDWRWWIGYDLEREEFVHFKKKSSQAESHIIPLNKVIKTVDFARLTRSLASKISDEKIDLYLDRADQLNRKIRDYSIPATVMKSTSMDDAVNIFARVNQRGRDMTPDQMVSALSFREQTEGAFDLSIEIDKIIDELSQYGFGNTERKSILQAILYAADLNFTKPAYERIVDRNSASKLDPAAKLAMSSLISAAKFLQEEVGLKSGRLLPYASQLIMISFYFQERTRAGLDGNRPASLLKKWFWITSFNGWFAGANTTDLRRSAEKIRDIASFDSEDDASFFEFFSDRPLRNMPRSFDRRSARIRASLVVQILSREQIDPKTRRNFDAFSVFEDEVARDIPYFFPNAIPAHVSDPANRVILPRGYGRRARTMFIDIPDSDQERICKSHFIEGNAITALRDGNVSLFLEERARTIKKVEDEFLFSVGVGEKNISEIEFDYGDAVRDSGA
ncbi:DUF262 domain-containing protein [Tistrella bauzanensis]|uniref:GmrSD restriction endonuclease domain-containing protein n=1 Tax=Tistrella TaxID=171436 RepID=UPI0031F6185F